MISTINHECDNVAMALCQIRNITRTYDLISFFFFFGSTVRTQDLTLARAGALPLEPLCQPFFLTGSPELFAWAGFEL
jgi:hypothetical protein